MSQEPLAATHLPLSRWGISRRQLEGRIRRRRWADRIIRGLMVASVVVVLIPLFSLLIYVGRSGIQGLDLAFFTQLPKPVGMPGGGMANAIVGSLILVGLAAAIGVPVGVMAGVFLARSTSRLADGVRFVAHVLNGVPSIVVGLAVYGLMVVPMQTYSAWAGGVALALIMIPLVTLNTEEMVRLVPRDLNEAALALGVPAWLATLRVVVRTALPGILTGIMLALARVAGETAPLLFTALNNAFWHQGLSSPIASLPVTIYNYAISPYPEWHQKAWTGALVLVAMVLITNVLARFFGRSRYDRR
ncbi:phosphate ABC transporter permease PstA [Limnochorda pilosa]|uniref:phosphate ABC transporter permease PstA n=1 Tax=Limnochorda pilosa TaxID=1555112 RepID=UPI0026EEB4B4|nr:phosphate ABC transporter permease PstA [Limnochorda pilosa]